MPTAVNTRSTRKAEPAAASATTTPPMPVPATPPTKASQLIALLQRDDGVSLTELATTLGWLPHTTRAALTGLRKKGHDIVKVSADEVTRYRIAPVGGEV